MKSASNLLYHYKLLTIKKLINKTIVNYNYKYINKGVTMNKPSTLESYYKRYIKNINKWLPDGLIEVDLALLQKLNLLRFHAKDDFDSALTRYFQVIESDGKLTLANEQFIIWIVPEKLEHTSVTYTMIALNKNNDIQLELAFVTSGVYNNSHLVLRLLEKFLLEIQGTEDVLSKLSSQISP